MERMVGSDALIREYVGYSMAAALIPIPLVDIGAVAAVQLRLVEKLARSHGAAYDRQRGAAILSSLVGAGLPKVGASLVKVLPGLGWLAGGVTQVVLSGATTHAVGHVFRDHFSTGRQLYDFDPARVVEVYREYFDKGRRVAESMCERVEPVPQSEGEVTQALERLQRLRRAGVLTEAEFEILEAAALRGE